MSNSGAVGRSASEVATTRYEKSAAYRKEWDRTRTSAAIAKLIVHRRTILRISQEQLAKDAGTSSTAISRLESGRAGSNIATVNRVFAALGCQMLIGYQAVKPSRSKSAVNQEVVAV